MMFKMEQGRLMEYHASIDSTGAEVVKEFEDLLIVETKDGVLLFRLRLFNRNAVIVAHTTFEILDTLRYVRSLGLMQ